MKQHMTASSLFILTVSGIIGSLVGCSPEQKVSTPPASTAPQGGTSTADSSSTSTGGQGYPSTTGTGGTSASNSSAPQGGNGSTGGANSVGGVTSTGGTSSAATGGTSSAATGGKTGATGGKTGATGGKTGATGGKTGATGGAATGGTSIANPAGGDAATGGAPPATTTTAANSGTTVTIGTNGKATGAMSGWASVALGSLDTITDPTCGGTAITFAAPCTTTTTWSASGVCVSGTVPVLPAAPTDADYTANWGLSVGVDSTAPAGNGLGQSFTSVTITVTGTPTTNLRAVVHIKSDAQTKTYCAALTSGTAIPFASFATDCYNATPTGLLATSSVTNIDHISVQVSSNSTAAITVNNLCITAITFTP